MPRANAMVPPEAIRIEDEVWQEAFARREPARANERRSLRAVDDARSERAADARIATSARRSATVAPRPVTAAARAGTASARRPRPVAAAGVAVPEPTRRTVKIQGRGAERNLPVPDARPRPPRRAYERHGFRPDRVAMWAVLLGFLLVLVAVLSAHG
jgi:hypothetical protein